MRVRADMRDLLLDRDTVLHPDTKLCFKGLTVTYKGEYTGTVVSEKDGIIEIELEGPNEIPQFLKRYERLEVI